VEKKCDSDKPRYQRPLWEAGKKKPIIARDSMMGYKQIAKTGYA
jgi:hypothetical protein